MNYADLQTDFSFLAGVTWPEPTAANSYFYVISSAKDQHGVSVADIEKGLDAYLPGAPISKLIGELPAELQDFVAKLSSSLTISQLGVAVGAKADNAYPVNAFNFVLELDFAKGAVPPIGGVTLTSVGLELNFVQLGDKLMWNPILAATCTFLDVQCGLTVGLFAPSITVMISETKGVNIDGMLQSATGSNDTSLASLRKQMGIAGTDDKTTLDMFTATAELSHSPSFSCALALTTVGWTWRTCSLDEIGIAFAVGGGDVAFSLATTLTIGAVEVDAGIEYDKVQDHVQVKGGIALRGAQLGAFLDQMAGELGFSNPLPGLTDVTLNGVAFTITDQKGAVSFQMSCDGGVLFDDTGSALNFSFTFDKVEKDVSVTLLLGKLTFTLADSAGTFVFTFEGSGSDTITVADIAHLARFYPLYEIGKDIEITLNKGVLALAKDPGSGRRVLFGLDFALDIDLQHDNSEAVQLLKMITGTDDIQLRQATLLAANQNWTVAELQAITDSPIPFHAPVNRGVSLSATLKIGDDQIAAPLTPPNTDNTTGTRQPPPTSLPAANSAKWFTVQKQIGPVFFDRVGLELTSSGDSVSLGLLADAAFTLGPMTISLEGFAIDVPFDAPKDFSVGLRGLNVSYDKAPLLISGGFLDQGDRTYIGDLEVRSASLFLAAIGEYSSKDDHTSLALFAALTDPPLGGPVFCYVTGLAAGGGYNSALKIPTSADQLPQFALLAAAGQAGPVKDPFQVIENSIENRAGEDWIAVGLLFRSFELVQSTALLTAAFGNNFEFAILAQSEMSVPPASADRIAYAQVDVEARYIPEDGELSVTGILTDSSYVFSKDCHIQGGFLFILQASGDFVLSFGGYAPDFDYAAHGYPAAKPLELIWNVDSHTSIKGSEYFALTPAAMMAGGQLQATWHSGIFSAWFDVNVDVMIQWRPFEYVFDFSMSLGVSFDFKILGTLTHFTFHIGAQLSVAGPPFHGHAHIELSVVSFDVDFGPTPAKNQALEWDEFRAMLPGKAAKDNTDSDLVAIKVTHGLQQDLSQSRQGQAIAGDGPAPTWVVNGTEFCFHIQTSLPVTETASDASVTEPPKPATIGILPMARPGATGKLTIKITDPQGNQVAATGDPTHPVVAAAINGDMATAHWGTAKPADSNTPPVNCTSGFTIAGGKPTPAHSAPVDLTVLSTGEIGMTAISDRVASATPFAS